MSICFEACDISPPSAVPACATTKAGPSRVLKALGRNDEECFQSIRIGLGKFVNLDASIAKILIEGIKKLK